MFLNVSGRIFKASWVVVLRCGYSSVVWPSGARCGEEKETLALQPEWDDRGTAWDAGVLSSIRRSVRPGMGGLACTRRTGGVQATNARGLARTRAGRKLLCRGGVTRKPIPPPPPSLAAVTGGGSSGRGCPTCRAGGGGVNPTSMAQNDTHVALIILTTQMWGGKLLVEKTFSGQILCSCAFGANIRSYTKQMARHGTPFLQPPPPSLLRRASMSPPPRRAIFRLPRRMGTGREGWRA